MKDAFAEKKPAPEKEKMNVAENDFVVKHRDDDPYGFYWISRERGQIPEVLSGAYTTIDKARDAIKTYLE